MKSRILLKSLKLVSLQTSQLTRQFLDLFPYYHHLPMYTGILVLAGKELNFFIVAHIVLCFGFVTKGVLIINQCFSYC